MQKTLPLAAVLAVMAMPAIAQQTAPPATAPQAPVAPPANAPVVTSPAPVTSGGAMWYTQTGNEMRASKLVGTSVQNAAGERIGEINEVIIGADGRVAAVVLGIGGFLGIGEREVAVAFSALKMSRDASGNTQVSVNATREILEGAPRWTWRSASK